MSNATHSPGPWELAPNGLTLWAQPGQGWTLGRIVAHIERGSGSVNDEAVVAANALLIAAAPELLSALEFVVAAHGKMFSGAIDLAREAIMKATGVQSRDGEPPDDESDDALSTRHYPALEGEAA